MSRTFLISLAASLVVPALSIAQQLPAAPASGAADSITGVELKGKAPVNPETLRVRLPKPQEAVLPNGMRVSLLEDHKLPMFSLQMLVSGGGLADPAERRGLAMVTATLLSEGTQQRSSREIAEQLATLGANLTAGASPASGESIVSLSGLTQHIDATFEIAADVIRNPAFPPAELEKFKTLFLSQLQYQRSIPGFLAQEQFMGAVYGEHPGSYIVPQESVIKALTSADLAKYHAAYYKPNNVILIAHGDITLKELTSRLEQKFGGWPKGDVPQVSKLELAPPEKPRVLLVDRPGSVQTSLWLGGLGIERNSEDYFPVLVMNHILGGGPASRLFVNLREDKGYTYGVYSSFTGSTFPGVVVASTDVRTAVTEGALHELTAEIERIIEEPVHGPELKNAKRALIGRFALSLDAPRALIANLATQKIYGLPEDYWDTYPQHVDAVTAEDIRRVAKKYYAADRLQIVAVGDGASVRKALEKYGAVETAEAGE